MTISATSRVSVADKTSRLLQYLSAVAREVGPSPARNALSGNMLKLVPADIPEHSKVRLGSSSQDAWLTVKRVPKPGPPELPTEIAWIVDESSIENPSQKPEFHPHRLERAVLSIYEVEERANEVAEQKEARTSSETAEQSEQQVLSVAGGRDSAAVEALREKERKKQQRLLEIRNNYHQLLNTWTGTTWKQWCEQVTPDFQARALYSKLYEFHLKLETEKADIEAVWGHCLISWKSAEPGIGDINFPLVNASVSIQLDPVDGTLRVIPEHEVRLELNAVEGTGLTGINTLQMVQQALADEPPNIWAPSEREALLRQLEAPLGAEAKVIASEELQVPGKHPVISAGWVLLERKRPMRQEAFYARLSEQIELTGEIPEALASIVSDSDTVDGYISSLNRQVERNDGTADRLLMPLPANDDQVRIAEQIATSRGVTVQGPPGTGKSHTIVNLLSHLVAQGKRVLVTAQNEQALKVVQDKIPEEIREFSIAVLGSTPAALEELRISAQTMRNSVSNVDVYRDSAKLDELGESIDKLREGARRADLNLVNALRSESQEFPLNGEQNRAPEVAQWVNAHHWVHQIQAAPTAEQQLPLSRAEIMELQQLSKEINYDQSMQALQTLPNESWIWPQQDFTDRVERLKTLTQAQQDLRAAGLNTDKLGYFTNEEITRLIDFCRKEAGTLASLSGVWEDNFSKQLLTEGSSADWVAHQNKQLLESVKDIRAVQERLLGKDIHIPEIDPNVALPELDAIGLRFQEGKKLSRLTGKNLRLLLEQIRYNGYAPSTSEHIDDIKLYLKARHDSRTLHRRMQDIYAHQSIPVPDVNSPDFVLQAAHLQYRVAMIDYWWRATYPQLQQLLRDVVQMPAGGLKTPEQITRVAELLERYGSKRELDRLQKEFDAQFQQLEESEQRPNASHIWKTLISALKLHNSELWANAHREAEELASIRLRVQRRNELTTALAERGAGEWAERIVQSQGDPEVVGNVEDIELAWTVAQAKTWLRSLHDGPTVEKLMERSHEISEELKKTLINFASLSARVMLAQNMKDAQRRALETWLTAIRKVGKGTGKNASKFQAQARQALPAAMGAVPVWIMPIYRVLENFDPRVSEMFDVVIVDESSQCDLLTLGVLALGKKSVIVGDDKQTSPAAVGIRTDRIFELQNQHVNDFEDKSLLTMDESLYSISSRAFPSTILLREHFRCVPEIIRFSNRFYGDKIFPLREVTVPEIGDSVRAIQVTDAVSMRTGNARTNRIEAERLVAEVVRCSKDPSYQGLTFGVVTMMSGPQANLIEQMLMEQLGLDEFERRKLRVGNPPMFQGDERNVVFISFIADDNSFAATRESNAQWANVAFSRAQDQIWLFYSMDPSTLNANDYRRAMIEYAVDRTPERKVLDLMEATESKFERDVLRDILDRGYDVTPQHEVGAYRIDMVINIGAGERLAVECDGDQFHGPEHWDNDVRRQRTLERIGWNFWRIRASEYYLDPKGSMQTLWERLETMKSRVEERERLKAEQDASSQREMTEQLYTGESLEEIQTGGEPETVPLEGEYHRDEQNGFASPSALDTVRGFDRAIEVADPVTNVHVEQAPVEWSLNRNDNHRVHENTRRFEEERSLSRNAKIRQWAIEQGYNVGERGRISQLIIDEYEQQLTEKEPRSFSMPSRDERWRTQGRFSLKIDGTIIDKNHPSGKTIIRGQYDLAAMIYAVRPGGGTFRVRADGEVLTAVNGTMTAVGNLRDISDPSPFRDE